MFGYEPQKLLLNSKRFKKREIGLIISLKQRQFWVVAVTLNKKALKLNDFNELPFHISPTCHSSVLKFAEVSTSVYLIFSLEGPFKCRKLSEVWFEGLGVHVDHTAKA